MFPLPYCYTPQAVSRKIPTKENQVEHIIAHIPKTCKLCLPKQGRQADGRRWARILRWRNFVPLAAFPATSGVDRSLDNMETIFHPTLVLLDAKWIERPRGNLEFHDAGETGPNADVLELWIVSGFPSPPQLVCVPC